MLRLLTALFLTLASLLPANAAKLFIAGNSVSTETKILGWSTGQSWGAIVASNAGLTPVFLAEAGSITSQQVSSQISVIVAQYSSGDDVSWQPGENDISVTPLATFRAAVDGGITALLAGGVPANKITLHTPLPIISTDTQGIAYRGEAPQYLQAMREVAFNRGVAFYDVYAHFSELTQTIGSISHLYMPDGQHPNVLGQAELARPYSLPQNAGWAAYHTASGFSAIAKPWIVTAPLHQVTGAGATLLSAQISYLDASGALPTIFHVQDYLPPSGEAALMLDGVPFPCPDSTPITPAEFSRMMIAPVAHQHDVWVSVTNGFAWSTGINFALTPP